LRILCIEVAPGKYEYIATNLDRDDFPPGIVKDLYRQRWGEENSFRDLKYTIDLVHFHCKKRDYVEQEAWARLIVYNFCEAITRHMAVESQSVKSTKHDYKINFATAACICKAYLKRNDGEIDVCRLNGRFLIPIRPNRTAPSIMLTPFISHNFFIISIISFLLLPYIILLLYFGIKTM
jgi:hypothetical protein